MLQFYLMILIGLKKKLAALAKEKDCSLVGEWIRSIINHLYWCALSTPDGNSDMMEAKWLSVVNHIRNRHTRHGCTFPRCLHTKYKRKRGEAIKWMKPGEIFQMLYTQTAIHSEKHMLFIALYIYRKSFCRYKSIRRSVYHPHRKGTSNRCSQVISKLSDKQR